ncbi:MAG: ABC transporter ATP-binding protein [Desulfobulbaceae bacterium]
MIELRRVSRTYATGDTVFHALHPTDLTIGAGEFVCVAGPSGSGKTTLLNLLGGVDRPSSGEVRLAGHRIDGLSATAMARMRRDTIGFVFQSFNLIPVLSVYENVEYILLLKGMEAAQRRELINAALRSVGLQGMERKRPPELSGGQQQRVAVARAIVGQPPVVLADEPTGSLDSRTGRKLMTLLRDINRRRGTTFVYSSHDPHVIDRASRVILLRDGAVVADRRQDG